MEYPLQSLQESRWFKLICGASFQHLPAVRSLTLAYGLAGADCIDVAADPVVVSAARDGIRALRKLRNGTTISPLDAASFSHHAPHPLALSKPWLSEPWRSELRQSEPWQSEPWQSEPQLLKPWLSEAQDAEPWLMVSLNDGDDPHFRKAAFDPTTCPIDCHRPCETICPTQAILFTEAPSHRLGPSVSGGVTPSSASGVIRDRCYGCGRCVSVCPIKRIDTESYTVSIAAIAPELFPLVDAVEIHTQIGRHTAFATLWQQLRPHLPSLKLVAVSCPGGEGFVDYLRSLYDIMTDSGRQPLPCQNLWQTDGRPMSGDIGKGTTHAAVQLAQQAIAAQLPGFIQLAGGTNDYTVPRLRSLGLLPHPALAGVAYGSYARKLLASTLDELEQRQSPHQDCPLEDAPDLLQVAIHSAHGLVSQIKFSSPPPIPDESLGTNDSMSLSVLNPV